MPNPRVSVIIAAANAAESLPRALDSVAQQDYEGDIDVVVAAADSPSAEAANGRALVISNSTGSTPTGLNLAVSASTGDVIIRLDAHATIPPTYVSRVVETLESTNAANVGGMQVPTGRSAVESAIAAAMASPFGAGDARYRVGGRPGPTDTVYLGAFRRSVFEATGGYDERYRRHQDYELNHRIRSAGGTVWFDPDLRVEYRPRPSFRALASQYFQYGQWKRYFSRSHRGALRPRQIAAPVLVLALSASLLGSLMWPWMLVFPALYLIALVLVGISLLPRVGAPALLTPLALMVMHVAWGTGFLLGHRSDS